MIKRKRPTHRRSTTPALNSKTQTPTPPKFKLDALKIASLEYWIRIQGLRFLPLRATKPDFTRRVSYVPGLWVRDIQIQGFGLRDRDASSFGTEPPRVACALLRHGTVTTKGFPAAAHAIAMAPCNKGPISTLNLETSKPQTADKLRKRRRTRL